jgi:hypothetical protein
MEIETVRLLGKALRERLPSDDATERIRRLIAELERLER